MSLENRVKWAEREIKEIDPLDFFRDYYKGEITRTQLAREDFSLYRILSRKDLLKEAIPNFDKGASETGKIGGSAVARNFGDDPVVYYTEHHEGLKRGQLQKENQSLYKRLRRDGLLEHVPTVSEFSDDPVTYYIEHHEGLTRGQLKKENPSLYQYLRRNELLEHVPLKR